jgi:hypothetical protein
MPSDDASPEWPVASNVPVLWKRRRHANLLHKVLTCPLGGAHTYDWPHVQTVAYRYYHNHTMYLFSSYYNQSV